MRALVCALVLIFSNILVFGQSCKSCDLDFKVCNGYYSSTLCIGPNVCSGTCFLHSKTSFLRSNSPGIVLEQHAGKLVVSSVIDNSPAQIAGVEVGDVLTKLNGRIPGGYSCNVVWSKDDEPALVTLRRGNKTINLSLSTVRISALIESANLVYASNQEMSPFNLEAPFTFGFRWEEHLGYLQVTQILAGSPAEHAGLKVGDEIVSVNGTSKIDTSLMRDSDAPKEAIIETMSGMARMHMNLQSRGIAEIVSSPRHQRIVPQMQRASLMLPTH